MADDPARAQFAEDLEDVRRDAALMKRVRLGDEVAFDMLLELYWSDIAAFASRLLGSADMGEDVAQQTFFGLWERRARWADGGSVRAYLFRTARNRVLNEERRRRTWRGWADTLRVFHSRSPSTPEEITAGGELEEAIAAALSALPPRRREVFELIRFHSMSYAQVAELLEISTQTVANQASAAVRTLRHELKAFLHDQPAQDAPVHSLVRKAQQGG